MLDALRMGRPLNAVMVFFATVIGGLLAGAPPNLYLPAALSATFISMGAQAVNDYFDVEVDKKKPHRKPLVHGSLTRKEGKYVFSLYYALGLLFAALSSPVHVVVAVLAVIGTYLYSAKIQSRKYLGNVVVSLFVALTMVYGGIGGDIWKTFLPALVIFLVNWGREILKDIDDGDIDFPEKVSLYHILGRRWANFFGTYLVFLGVVFSPFPYLFSHLDHGYIVIISLADLIALFAVAEALNNKEGRAEKILKVAMVVALLAFGAGVVG